MHLPHRFTARLAPWFCALLVGLSALLPRVVDLGIFITHDEAEFWIDRSHAFLWALQHHDYAATAITTHPGVTTMWLGSAGIVLRRTLFEWGILQRDPFPTVLALMQLPAALTHVVGILVGYWLLRRLLPATMALLAAMLWALDPFIIGYSRLLHVDALAGTFATLCLLAACDSWYRPSTPPHPNASQIRLPSLILSGVCGALAALSKSPALAVVPVVVGIALTSAWVRSQPGTLRSILQAAYVPLLLWGGVAMGTVMLVWPAVWADSHEVYRLLRIGVESEGAQPHMTGNFFLGQRNDAPGPLFYPVALVLRTTPWTLAGILLLGGIVIQSRRSTPPEAAPLPHVRTLATLAAFVILFIVAMSIFPKKFNRYLVLAFPMVDILAAVGLVWGMQWLAGKRQALLGAVVCGVAIVNAAWWHPYAIASFNQALGGARTGAHTFAVGWGEGLEQVAAWLNAQPDSTGVLTISRMITSLNPYLGKGVQAFFPSEGELRESAGYVVVYVNEVQGGPPLAPFDQFYGQATPLHVVELHGVAYAWVYQVPPPVAQPVQARFGDALELHGFAVAGEAPARAGEPHMLTLSWAVHSPPRHDYWLFARVVGADGQTYAQVDLPYATSEWQAGRFLMSDLLLPLPADLPAGQYRVLIGLYDQVAGQRLPLSTPPQNQPDPALNQPDALLLTLLEVE